ncbi:MAG: hypothetical protein HZC17_02380 [Candidatus Omnitrophica bacterium]|nr:hypothetical protein [Candidatus Omnitrophota bacterium]
MFKNIAFGILFFTLLMGSFAFAQVGKNSICPVMPGECTKDQFHVDYNGERIYLCCKACVKGFKRDPEKYFKNFKSE